MKLQIVAMSVGAVVLLAGAAQAASYPAMAPIAQYRSASDADEIALARSAAPPSISGAATVMTLGAHGYDTPIKGTNGFVCIVERSWANDFGKDDFWNPKVRGPICFNPASAKSVLPTYLRRTEWVLAGVPQAEMIVRTKAALASGAIVPPEPGAMCFMLSKGGYLSDDGGHWHPHLMFFAARTAPLQWGANLPGSPVQGGESGTEPYTLFFVLVAKWSDGTPAEMKM